MRSAGEWDGKPEHAARTDERTPPIPAHKGLKTRNHEFQTQIKSLGAKAPFRDTVVCEREFPSESDQEVTAEIGAQLYYPPVSKITRGRHDPA
jgi:hypothetical protein